MSRTSFAAAFVVLAAAFGCSSDTSGPPDAPPTLSVVSGDGQKGLAGRYLPDPLIVQVTSASGNPVEGLVVLWSVSGGGEIVPGTRGTDASGRVQAQWGLGFSGPQEVEARIFYPVSGKVSPISAKFSATLTTTPPSVQQRPTILHYDGSSWTVAYQPAVAEGVVSLLSIWGGAPSSIYAVGEYCGVEAYVKYDGTSWTPAAPEAPPGCTGLGPIENNVTGSSPSNVFLIQSGGAPSAFGTGSVVQHFDGTNWTNTTWTNSVGSACTTSSACLLDAVWTDSPNNAFVVGDGGWIGHYDGTAWTRVTSGTTARLRAVWGVASAASPRVFAVGDAGTILTYDGTSWQPQSSGTTQILRAVWGTSATDVFAAGDNGVILHYDGTTWSTQNNSGHTLYGIWGSSSTSVFAVGDGPTVLHYDGSSWTSTTVTIPIDLRAIWGSSANDVYAVGKGQ